MRQPFLENGIKLIPIIGIIIICFLASFRIIQNFNTLIIGKWDAVWIIQNSGISNGSRDNMKGYMEFHENGVVGIEARGYPGCIFSSDTIQNQLMWKVTNDTLHLYNPNDQFKLSYFIQNASENTINLKLLDDIFVTLNK